MTPNTSEREIEILIRARYPLIYLVSWEEARAERMLARVAERQGKKIFIWSVTRGLCDEMACDKNLREPAATLDFIEKSDQRAIFVLRDFHAFMQDAAVIRRLRDIVSALKASYKTVLILSPQLTIPVELEKDISVVDYDLPGAKELESVLNQVASASQSGSRFRVQLNPADKERLIQAAMGMTLTEMENALAKAIVQDSTLDVNDMDTILQEKKQIIRKSRLLEYFEAKEEFGQIGGLEILKDWLSKRGTAFSTKAREFGLPEPKGILLLGVQGCGKSLTCKAISGLWKLPLLRLDMGSVFGGFVGQSEENMRRAIKTAESISPCILWLDEIEKGLSGTQSSNFSDAGTTARVFSTFLTWLQEKKKPVFVAATANNIQMLPPELLRKGRLDEIFFIDLPTAKERQEIFLIHIRKTKRDPAQFNLEQLAQLAAGFSGAEIEQAITAALYEAFHQNRDINQDDVVKVIASFVPLSKTMREEIDRLREWATSRARPASLA
jgi:SpoVK/Ycf46/Vps4 family AAA+-type ATPase